MDFIEESVVNLDASLSNIAFDDFADGEDDIESTKVSTSSSSNSVAVTPNIIQQTSRSSDEGGRSYYSKDNSGHRSQDKSTVLVKTVTERRSSIGDLFSGTVDAITGMPIQGMKMYIHSREHYDGPFLNGLRHGDGAVCTFLDGSGKYIGSYYQDFRRKGTLMTDKFTYTGTFKNDVFHGQGMLAKSNGAVYNGSFKNGLKHGKGTLVEKEPKSDYDGQFLFGKKEGFGIIKFSNGYQYKGEWKENKKNGKGLEILPNGERYEGDFQNDKRHGEGHLTTTSRVTQRGTWQNGIPIDGKWIFVYENGTMYEGNTRSLRPFGHGIMTYFDQNGQNLVATYEGEFVNCLRHGYGMCKFESDGQEHWGDWIADEPLQLLCDELKIEDSTVEEEDLLAHKVPESDQESLSLKDDKCQSVDLNKDNKTVQKDIPNSQDPDNSPNQSIGQKVEPSTHYYINGDTYHGVLDENNQREGSGTYISKRLQTKYICKWAESRRIDKGSIFFLSGTTYEGEFHNNIMEGFGKLQMVDGSVYVGEFKKGLFDGKGTLDDKICNSFYNGTFLNGLKHGKGEEKSLDGTKYVGEYKQGTRCGEGILTKVIDEEDHLIYQGQWSEDQMHGEGERVYKYGNYNGRFVKNQRKGRGVYLFNDGSAMDGKWDDDKPSDGDWVINYPDETTFYGMAKVFEDSILPDGSVKSLTVPHGFGTSKNSRGILYSGYFAKGKKHGTGICVFPDGEKWDGRWENDIFTRNGIACPTFEIGTL